MEKKLIYDESSISHLTGLDPIRARPTAFINSLDCVGQETIARELIDNSCDELNNVSYPGELRVILFRDKKRKTYQLMVIDNGRGFPIGKFKELLTTLWMSGKHKQDAYDTSGGLLGVGAKCQAALSTMSRAITMRDGKLAMLDMSDGKVLGYNVVPIPDTQVHGTFIMYEPAPKWTAESTGMSFEMQDIPYFSEVGFLDLVKLIRVRDIFNDNIRFVFQLFDTPLPRKVWDLKTTAVEALDAIGALDNVIANEVIYDSAAIANKSHFLLEYLGVEGSVVWELDNFKKPKMHANDKLSFQGKLMVVKGAKKANSLVLVNSIVMKTDANSPQSVALRVFGSIIANHLEDAELKKFFLTSGYQAPLQFALSVKYSGAQFAGTTKDTFRDKVFEAIFEKELSSLLALVPDEHWKTLADAILPDLEQKYSLYYNKPMEQKTTRNLILELNNPGLYTECKTADRSKAELFLVEGTSAAHLKKALDNEFQALMSTRGKPLNVMNTTNDRRIAFQKLSKDPIFGDVIRVSGITPATKLSEGINFSKIVITTDADPEGAHIGAIYIGDFHMLNPEILESGILYLATPALYVMHLGRGKKLLLRNKAALDAARINHIYSNVIDVEIQNTVNGEIVALKGESYYDFCSMILHLGEQFANVSRQLNIPLLILERLTYGIDYLVPTLDLDGLESLFHNDHDDTFVRFTLQPNLNMLIVSIDEQDVPVSLGVLGDTIRTQILPSLIHFKWRNWMPLITTKVCANMKRQPATLMQVYHALQELNSNKFVRIDRIKGLGEASVDDLKKTVGDPESRTLHRITSLGDVERIYTLLGHDSDERKNLMRSTGFLSSSMRK